MGTLNEADLRHLLGEAAATFDEPEDGAVLVLDAAEAQERVVPLLRRRWVRVTSAAAVLAVGTVLGVGLFGGDGTDRVGQLAGAGRPSAADDQGTTTGPGYQAESGRKSLSYGTYNDTARDALPAPAAAPATGPQSLPRPAAGSSGAGADGGATGGVTFSPLSATLQNAPGGNGAPAAAPAADGARVVKKGSIALLVKDGQVTPILTRVAGFAKAAGGVVQVSATEETGATPSGSVTLRVPVDAFEQVVGLVRSMGADVRSATTSGQDVTATYADLEAQLRTLTAARERFLKILERANSIGDVLSVQQRVDDVSGKIDRLEGQRRVLAAQSDTATLQVTVTEADDPAVQVAAPRSGLSRAFSDAGTGFSTGVEALIRLSGRGLLLALLLAVAYGVLRTGWRLWSRRMV